MTIEVDPHGIGQHELGAKMDALKPDMSYLVDFSNALKAIAYVCMYGARKYTRNGWKHVPAAQQRYLSAELRHIFNGEEDEFDMESNLPHVAQAAWNALARLEKYITESDDDILKYMGGVVNDVIKESN